MLTVTSHHQNLDYKYLLKLCKIFLIVEIKKIADNLNKTLKKCKIKLHSLNRRSLRKLLKTKRIKEIKLSRCELVSESFSYSK